MISPGPPRSRISLKFLTISNDSSRHDFSHLIPLGPRLRCSGTKFNFTLPRLMPIPAPIFCRSANPFCWTFSLLTQESCVGLYYPLLTTSPIVDKVILPTQQNLFPRMFHANAYPSRSLGCDGDLCKKNFFGNILLDIHP